LGDVLRLVKTIENQKLHGGLINPLHCLTEKEKVQSSRRVEAGVCRSRGGDVFRSHSHPNEGKKKGESNGRAPNGIRSQENEKSVRRGRRSRSLLQ